ncbi:MULTISPECIES: hypothetical protein [Pseudoalteromonas]|uniref:Uncharacterized protein n=3 Tax=Pseudoalteromonas TaxID=53246 RepID=A0A2A5JJ87_PSEO7|nr:MULTISPECIES: hypothetical protein [Pseudoalteromonas]MCG9761763.1 hypothetical protein [Pseudoalteromonas sp. Isolate6]NSY36553.1 hypothetical protein [Pseudoalteromonas sp. JC28]NSY36602.1 hypothetical protein [Pseudoalteromonas sp. JC28]PAY00161.1 hypothetical protein CKO50_17200 [Pseudoalteromonas sp. HM-SA03]PCK29520.1 hypothetical protein CEX98_22595 [Pseudoalteromonas piscicida]
MTKPKRRQWSRVVARSLPESLQLCKEHGMATRNMSVPRIADRTGVSTDMLYKYLGNGDMPASLLIPYMAATGREYPLQYMAHSLDKLVVDMPKSKKPSMPTLNHLNQFANQVIGMAMQLEEGGGNHQHVAEQIVVLMQELAYQKLEVERLDDPQQQLI